MTTVSKMLVKTTTPSSPVCVVCGKKATETNSLNLPGCSVHVQLPTKIPACPNCDAKMTLKTGKRGAFWGCPDYPTCYGTRNLVTPEDAPDIL